jgi:hypothetical protein
MWKGNEEYVASDKNNLNKCVGKENFIFRKNSPLGWWISTESKCIIIESSSVKTQGNIFNSIKSCLSLKVCVKSGHLQQAGNLFLSETNLKDRNLIREETSFCKCSYYIKFEITLK